MLAALHINYVSNSFKQLTNFNFKLPKFIKFFSIAHWVDGLPKLFLLLFFLHFCLILFIYVHFVIVDVLISEEINWVLITRDVLFTTLGVSFPLLIKVNLLSSRKFSFWEFYFLLFEVNLLLYQLLLFNLSQLLSELDILLFLLLSLNFARVICGGW